MARVEAMAARNWRVAALVALLADKVLLTPKPQIKFVSLSHPLHPAVELVFSRNRAHVRAHEEEADKSTVWAPGWVLCSCVSAVRRLSPGGSALLPARLS